MRTYFHPELGTKILLWDGGDVGDDKYAVDLSVWRISRDEIDLFIGAKVANPYWFGEFIRDYSIIVYDEGVRFQSKSYLRPKEVEILAQLRTDNFDRFSFVCRAASVMIERRYKYAGDHHPFFNFYDTAIRANAQLLELGIEDQPFTPLLIAVQYASMKASRLETTGNQNFADESTLDSQIDMFNYRLLMQALHRHTFTPAEFEQRVKFFTPKT